MDEEIELAATEDLRKLLTDKRYSADGRMRQRIEDELAFREEFARDAAIHVCVARPSSERIDGNGRPRRDAVTRARWPKPALWTVSAVLIGTAYLSFSLPGEVVVDRHGLVVGLSNRARSAVQAERFWVNQLAEIDAEIERHQSALRQQAEINARLQHQLKHSEAILKRFYAHQPSARSTTSQTAAEGLRQKADEIEAAELDKLVEHASLRRMTELQRIRPIVESKARAFAPEGRAISQSSATATLSTTSAATVNGSSNPPKE